MTGPRLTQQEIDFIRDAYAKGVPVMTIASVLGKTANAIKGTAHRYKFQPKAHRREPDEPIDDDLNSRRHAIWSKARDGARKALAGMRR